MAAVISYDLFFFKKSGITPGSSIKPAGIKKGRSEAVLELKLSLLDKPRPAYTGALRDIFSPLREEVKRPETAISPSPAQPPPVQTVVPPKLSRFKVFSSEVKFLGFLEKKDGKTAFLSRGDDVYIVKKGDRVNGYRVTEIADNILVLTDDEGGEQAGIDLRR